MKNKGFRCNRTNEQAWRQVESEFLIEHQIAIACHAWDGYQQLGRGCVTIRSSKHKGHEGVRLDYLALSRFATIPECENLRTAAETYDPSTQVVVWLINSARHISDVYTLAPKSSPSECFNSLSQQWDEFGFEIAGSES